LREGSLRAYVLPNVVDHARLGIIIGRRQTPRAVMRNRVKRLTRESFRLRCTGFGAIDVVVQVLSVTGTDETKAALAALWDRIESANVENDASNV
jgi:ribonuclease P protein component